MIELCRKLGNRDSPLGPSLPAKGPVSPFLSHTKLDLDVEPRVTLALLDYLKHDQHVRAWVDAGDIEAGPCCEGTRGRTGRPENLFLPASQPKLGLRA